MKKIIFLHTDLGLGGAEQLVVTAALALRLYKNAEVEILTTRYDPKRCFDETRRDIAVTCVGSFLPFTILGKLRAFCSFIRMLYMSCYVLFQSFFFGQTFDAIIVDAISTTVPILKWCKKPVCFYCHFPDALLCTTSGGWLTRQYRTVMDGLERLTIGAADELCVNSRFTKSILREHYPHLKKRQIHIIYPCVNGVSLKKNKKTVKDWSKIVVEFPRELENLSPRKYILSLNRYERKKSLGRAIQVLVWLKV